MAGTGTSPARAGRAGKKIVIYPCPARGSQTDHHVHPRLHQEQPGLGHPAAVQAQDGHGGKRGGDSGWLYPEKATKKFSF
jgi:hypothetical protein